MLYRIGVRPRRRLSERNHRLGAWCMVHGACEGRGICGGKGRECGLFDRQETDEEVRCQVFAGPERAADYQGARGMYSIRVPDRAGAA